MVKTTTLSRVPWRKNKALKALFDVFEEHDYPLYIVGGAVRDAVLLPDQQHKDIDLSTAATPSEVKAVLSEYGITVVPTGEKYGTITAVVDKVPFEITTFRKDLTTDGRHATVRFTGDMCQDAERRDFTINALYASFDGLVIDPLETGLDDILKKKLRFIGEPSARIKEDYLRILRFFRFIATTRIEHIDKASLHACEGHSNGLAKISKERIIDELYKLIEGFNALESVQLLSRYEILHDVLPRTRTDLLQAVLDLKVEVPPQLKLYTLFMGSQAFIEQLPKWPFSNDDKALFRFYASHKAKEDFNLEELYYLGREKYLHALLLLAAAQTLDFPGHKKRIQETLHENIAYIKKWVRPVFPLTGIDLMENGIKQGPQLGERLRKTEKWWVQNQFTPTKNECLIYAMKCREG